MTARDSSSCRTTTRACPDRHPRGSAAGDSRPPEQRASKEIDPYYGDSANNYAPTDTEPLPDGTLLVTDGYTNSKLLLSIDLGLGTYVAKLAGGKAPKDEQAPGRFSTCHGLVRNPLDETVTVADGEHRWI